MNFARRSEGICNEGKTSKQMKIHFRTATGADYGFLYDLMAATMKEYVAAIWGWDEAWQRARFREKFSETAWRIIVADGFDAGAVALEERPGETYLAYLYVLPDFQGWGIGTEVVRSVQKKAARRNEPVTLNVLRSNVGARRLYERLGFQTVDEDNERAFLRARPSSSVSGDTSTG